MQNVHLIHMEQIVHNPVIVVDSLLDVIIISYYHCLKFKNLKIKLL